MTGTATQVFLTTEELAARYRVTVPTVRYWRQIGKGPQGTRIGKRVLYALADCETYEAALSAQ